MHEVETMAFANALPWHGLGQRVDSSITVDDMLVAAGLDWEVRQFPLFAQIGTNGKPGSKRIGLPNRQALVRMSDEKVLTVTGKNWKPLQNRDAIEFFRSFAEAGQATLETAGSLRGGQIIWGLAKLNDSFKVTKDDKVEGYILLVSPHEAGKAIKVQTTSVRVVCANTLAISQKKKQAEYSQHHLKDFDPESAKLAIDIAHSEFKKFELDAHTLHNLEMSEFESVRFLAKFFQPVEQGISEKADKLAVEQLMNEPASHRKAFAEVLKSWKEGPGAEQGTAWGTLNGITHWVDHVAGNNNDARLYRSWLANTGLIAKKAKEELLELAK